MSRPRAALARLGLCLLLLSCSQDQAPAEPQEAPPFVPLSAAAYTAKVKDLLTGQAPTASELAQVRAEPAALGGLIDSWMERPEFAGKMLALFKQAFQQTQVGAPDYDEQLGFPTNSWFPLHKIGFVRSAEESFGLTAWQLIKEDRPFTEVLTTERFALNPPLMSALSFMDAVPIDDQGQPVLSELWILRDEPTFSFTRQTQGGPIPIEQSLDARSPNYMKWYDPNPYGALDQNPACKPDPLTVRSGTALVYLFSFLYGGRPACYPTYGVFTDADYRAWRMVTIRRPAAGERRLRFYDVPALRTATELALETPRVGFLTTPAFLANWPTNASNSARVTVNQALIVGLGKSFDDTATTVQITETSDDAGHARPGTTCYGCHQTLDPMRQFFRQSYSLSYHRQYDAAQGGQGGTFALDGVVVKGDGVRALAQAMAAHPRFAAAWAQKLCRWANSSSCVEDDPELLRVAEAFRQSGYRFKALVRALMSSPLVTSAAPTKTAAELGPGVSIRRREHLCAALDTRLGLTDACAISGIYYNDPPREKARGLSLAIPGSGYTRGAESPLLPRDANLFFQSSAENLCLLLSEQVVDGPMASRYRSADSDSALRDLAQGLMGLAEGDERSDAALAILRDHHQEALAGGASGTDALRSAFVLACTSPFALSTGL